MFFFNKKQSILPSERFSFMPLEEQKEFIINLQDYFQDKHGYILDFTQGVVHGSNKVQYGLDNLAQKYHHAIKYGQINNQETKEVIADHFNDVFEEQQEGKAILKDRAAYSKMKKYIAVRLLPREYLHVAGEDRIIYREDMEGILTALVYDLPSQVVTINKSDVAKWNISTEDLFKIGFNNTFSNNKVDVTYETLGKNVTLGVIGSENHLLATTVVYNLSEYENLIGQYGSIISAPHRHTLLVLPIKDKSVVSIINQLIIITDGLYKEGPGSISPNIFWYNNNKFINLPYKFDANQIQFSPPNEFIDMLKKL